METNSLWQWLKHSEHDYCNPCHDLTSKHDLTGNMTGPHIWHVTWLEWTWLDCSLSAQVMLRFLYGKAKIHTKHITGNVWPMWLKRKHGLNWLNTQHTSYIITNAWLTWATAHPRLNHKPLTNVKQLGKNMFKHVNENNLVWFHQNITF